MSEMFGVRVVQEDPRSAELEITAVHPDADGLPFPGHRPAWAALLLSAIDATHDDTPPELAWRVAARLESIRLLDVCHYPRTSDAPPAMRVRVTVSDDRGLLGFASDGENAEWAVARAAESMRDGWGAYLASTDAAAVPRVPSDKSKRWTVKRGAALAKGARHAPEVCLAELARAGREGAWYLAESAVLSYRDEHDVVPLLLDHAHESSVLAEAAWLCDPRLDEAVTIALGDPSTARNAALVLARRHPDFMRSAYTVLEHAIAAFHASRSRFRARGGRLLGMVLDWVGARVLDDSRCAQRVAALSPRAKDELEREVIAATPYARRDEALAAWPSLNAS